MGGSNEILLFRSSCGYILVTGLAGEAVTLRGNAALIPSRMYASLRHLVMAAHRACRSIRRGVNIADAFAYELGMCLLGSREIDKVRRSMSVDSGGFAFVSVCDEPMECLGYLLRALTTGMELSDLRAGLSVEERPHCSDEIDALAMEEGAMLELDR